MKTLFALALMLSSTLAHAGQVITLDKVAIVSYPALTYLSVRGEAAEKIYDSLSVKPVQDPETVIATEKTAAGISCRDEFVTSRSTECLISVDAAKGVVGAVKGADSSNTLTLSLSGNMAQEVYNLFTVQASAEDPEFYNFSKPLVGILAQQHRLTNSYDIVLILDPAAGILQ